MKIQCKLPLCIKNTKFKPIIFFSSFYGIDFLINFILTLFLFSLLTKILIKINNVIKKNNLKNNTSSYLIRFLSTFVYLIPYFQLKNMYNDEFKRINFLRYNFIRLLPNKIKSNIIKDLYFHNIIFEFILKNETILLLIFFYFFIVKEKKLKLNYFFRFHTIHAILILFLQISLMFLRKYLFGFAHYVPSNQLKIFITTFANTILIFNLGIIFYSIFCAANNLYTNIPFITPGCESHIGKNNNVK